MRYTEAIDETYRYTVSPADAGARLDAFLTARTAEAAAAAKESAARDAALLLGASVALVVDDGDPEDEAAAADATASDAASLVCAGPRDGCSRSFLQKLIADGLVRVNAQASKASRKLKAGETVELNIPQRIEMSAEPQDIPLEILYEDADIVVLNKRPGMVVHPSAGHESGTIVNALLHHCRDLSGIGGELRPGIVHRLDRDTSGCLVCAKSDRAHRNLVEQFAERQTHKIYLTITHGTPRPAEGKVEGGIARSLQDRKKMALFPTGGRYSLTLYRTLEDFGGFALVECDIKTGRTHQIRLHMRSVGAPVLCDADYGKESEIAAAALRGEKTGAQSGPAPAAAPVLRRQALHAHKLSFLHPVLGERMEFTSPLPEDMVQALTILRSNSSL